MNPLSVLWVRNCVSQSCQETAPPPAAKAQKVRPLVPLTPGSPGADSRAAFNTLVSQPGILNLAQRFEERCLKFISSFDSIRSLVSSDDIHNKIKKLGVASGPLKSRSFHGVICLYPWRHCLEPSSMPHSPAFSSLLYCLAGKYLLSFSQPHLRSVPSTLTGCQN